MVSTHWPPHSTAGPMHAGMVDVLDAAAEEDVVAMPEDAAVPADDAAAEDVPAADEARGPADEATTPDVESTPDNEDDDAEDAAVTLDVAGASLVADTDDDAREMVEAGPLSAERDDVAADAAPWLLPPDAWFTPELAPTAARLSAPGTVASGAWQVPCRHTSPGAQSSVVEQWNAAGGVTSHATRSNAAQPRTTATRMPSA